MNINSVVKQIIKMKEHFNKLVFEGGRDHPCCMLFLHNHLKIT